MPEYSVDQAIDHPTVVECGGGRLIQSYAILDRGHDPFRYFTKERNILRLLLGDIQFIGRFDHNVEMIDLLIAPEYPSDQFRSMRSVMTFYGIIVNRAMDEPTIEIRAWDSSYRHLDWDHGIALLHEVDVTKLGQFQCATLRDILALEELRQAKMPNYSREEMRSIVGSPTGARISIVPLVLGRT